MVRYSIREKRKEQILGKYGKTPGEISLVEAKLKAAQLKADVRAGIDPSVEKKRNLIKECKTFADLAATWLDQDCKHLQHPQIPARIIRKDINPNIGDIPINQVTPLDIQALIRKIADSGGPSISNDALLICKNAFSYGIRMRYLQLNPAADFKPRNAGVAEKSRDRVLSLDEIDILFRTLRAHHVRFTRENYLLVALLLIFAVRKGELIAAKWSEFDFDKMVWLLPAERTKTKKAIKIPIPNSIAHWFEELRIRACGSEYVFPARRAGKRRDYISDDTISHAISKMFGEKVSSKKVGAENTLGDAGLAHFVIHDLRRTCRSLLSLNRVPPHIAERCLNHAICGVMGIYDHYDYFDERKEALAQIASQIVPLVDPA